VRKIFLLFLSLIFVLNQLPAYAAEYQSGARCNKVNQTVSLNGLQFKCIKSGNKLTWIKKKLLDKPAKNVIVRYPEALSVQKILDSSNFKNFNKKITAQWYFEDTNDVNAAYWTKLGLENALKLYGSLGFDLTDPTIFIPDNEQWLRDSIAGIGCGLRSYLDSLGWVEPCNDGKLLIVVRSYHSIKYGSKPEEFEFQHVIAHEYFHQIQYSLLTNQHYPIPIWMIEGAAHFFSSLAFYSWNTNRNYETHLDYLLKHTQNYYLDCLNIDLSAIPFDGTWDQRKCGYSKGSKATEYLVAKYGVTAYIQMLKLSRVESFENAFQSTTGQSLQDFYADVEVFLRQQGWSQ
jgi:hypothetical protein